MSPAMAETVEFASNGRPRGVTSLPDRGGSGPGVLVVQEWWGLDPSIKEVADRLGRRRLRRAGARPVPRRARRAHEMDKAAQLMTDDAARPRRARHERRGRLPRRRTTPSPASGIGVVGFCMGGMLVVPHRRQPARQGQGRRARSTASRRATWSPTGRSSTAVGARAHGRARRLLRARRRRTRSRRSCRAWARTCTFTVHPGTGHAFMGPHNALGTLDEQKAAEHLARRVVSCTSSSAERCGRRLTSCAAAKCRRCRRDAGTAPQGLVDGDAPCVEAERRAGHVRRQTRARPLADHGDGLVPAARGWPTHARSVRA